MPINSKQKGARLERELASLFRENGYAAKRGCQHSGGKDSPDVKLECEAPNLPIHIESKGGKSIQFWKAFEQAEKDCQGKMPTVWFRRDRDEWRVSMKAKDFFELLRLQ